MKFKYIFTSVIGSALLLSSCMDKFSDINTDPSIVNKADLRYQLTQVENDFLPSDYWAWFYDYTTMLKWGQVTVESGGNTPKLNLQDGASGGTNNIKNILATVRDMDHTIAENPNQEDANRYRHIQAMSHSIVIFTMLQNIDMYGSKPYSEMGYARYGGTLTPKYDTQEEILKSFVEELKALTDVLHSSTYSYAGKDILQVNPGKQDMFYNGDASKWARFTNSLLLKVAVRLYNVDADTAIKIVEDAVNHPAGLITEAKYDFINNKGIKYYGPNETVYPGVANKLLIDFFKENRDPRLRFFFTKNSYNSKVVQAYFDAKALDPMQPSLPSYIAEVVETEQVNGKTLFKGWKAPGEPWVRYQGAPSQIDAGNDNAWAEYFDKSDKLATIKIGDSSKSYSLLSGIQLQHYRNNTSYAYPDSPLVTVTPVTDPRVLYSYIMNSAEVNLYLAEFALLGANVNKTADEYFTAGIKQSVEAWDKMSSLNKLMYYHEVYDPNEASIKLQPGEVEELLKKDAYKLTNDRNLNLEKVYLQQRFNFTYMPQEMYVTMRRSGIPKFDSTVYPFEHFTKDNSVYPLPRRFPFRSPTESDKMRDNILKSFEEQGFSIGFEPQMLNTQRVWYDKNAPQFGEGFKY